MKVSSGQTHNQGSSGEPPEPGHSPDSDSIKHLVMQEAAAAIMAAGRELSGARRLSVRDFLRGPALKVGLALSVMGVTMWISQANQQGKHRSRTTAGQQRGPRQRRGRSSSEREPHAPEG
jgi:hypothetical protein